MSVARLLRRWLACAVCAALISAGAGCSQPLDPNSPAPPASQPFITLLALVGVGVAVTALHHHNEHRGGGQGVQAVAPLSVETLPTGVDVDLTPDDFLAGQAGLVIRAPSGVSSFVEAAPGATTFSSYALPAGYNPTAVAIDLAGGNDWFVDSTGSVRKCAAPGASITTCVPAVAVSDGLGIGARSIAADASNVFVARDDGAGTVKFASFGLDGNNMQSGSYAYTGSGLAAPDAVSAITGAALASTFVLVHADGKSFSVSLPSTTAKNAYVLTPLPNASSSVGATLDSGGNTVFLGALGDPAGAYSLGRWTSSASARGGPGSLVATIPVAVNGRTGGVDSFGVPFVHLRATAAQGVVALDGNGRIVFYAPF